MSQKLHAVVQAAKTQNASDKRHESYKTRGGLENFLHGR